MIRTKLRIEVYNDGFCLSINGSDYNYSHNDGFDKAAEAIKYAVEAATDDEVEVVIEDVY